MNAVSVVGQRKKGELRLQLSIQLSYRVRVSGQFSDESCHVVGEGCMDC